MNEGIENHFRGTAYSISTVKGEEFGWSTSMCKASSKPSPIFKSRSRLLKSSSTSSAQMARGSRGESTVIGGSAVCGGAMVVARPYHLVCGGKDTTVDP
ncbi:hypothetical protein L3X38_043523 [Prunus dulcis]|uniref:Uncharacterized protein n=1 Tax=Prunus dulcis TaxID=3755 RepID=A0AAD4YLC1_PRUDU|nr:hypothetical protein L3X38_043523 [Prunus dulcis]